MVSGHGVKGGRGRCYTLWRDFMACLETEGSISMKICRHQRDDYMECLHHVKLVRTDSLLACLYTSIISLSPSILEVSIVYSHRFSETVRCL